MSNCLISIFLSFFILSFQALGQTEHTEQAIHDYIKRVEFFDQHCYAEGSEEEYTDNLIVMEDGGFFACEEEFIIIQSMQPEMEVLIDDETILDADVTCENQDLSVSENIDDMTPVVSVLTQRTTCQDQEKIARTEKCGEEMTCNGLRALRKVIPGKSIDKFVENYAEKNELADSCLDDSRGNCLVNAWAAAKANWSGTVDAFGALLDGETWSNIFSKVSLPTWSSLKNRALKTQENVAMMMSSDGRAEMFLNMQKSIVEKVDPWLRSQVLCQKWEGEPHASECLEKLESLDCLSCSEYTNTVCAAISVLASEGALLFFTGGAATVTSLAVKGTVRMAVPRMARVATRIAATAPEVSAAARASNKARVGSSVVSVAAKKSMALAELAAKMGTDAFQKIKRLVESGKLKLEPITNKLASAANVVAKPANYVAELGEKTVNFIVMKGTPTSLRNSVTARNLGRSAASKAVDTTTKAGSRAVIANRIVRVMESYSDNLTPNSDNRRRRGLGGNNSSDSRGINAESPLSGSSSKPQQSDARTFQSSNTEHPTSQNTNQSGNQNSNQKSGQNTNQNPENESGESKNSSGSNLGGLVLGADVLAKSTGLGQSEVEAELASIINGEIMSKADAISQSQSIANQANNLQKTSVANANGSNQSNENSSPAESTVQSAEQARKVLNRSGQGAMTTTEYEQTRQKMEAFYAEENKEKVLEQIRAIKGVDEQEAQQIFDSRRTKVYDALDYMADASGNNRTSRSWLKFKKASDRLQAEINLLEKNLLGSSENSEAERGDGRDGEEFNTAEDREFDRSRNRLQQIQPKVSSTPTPSGSRGGSANPTVNPESGETFSSTNRPGLPSGASIGTVDNSGESTPGVGRAPASVVETVEGPSDEDEEVSQTSEMESLLDKAVSDGEELPWSLDEISTSSEDSRELLNRLKEIKEMNGSVTGQYSLRERDGAVLHEFKIGEEAFLFDILPNGQARLLGQ